MAQFSQSPLPDSVLQQLKRCEERIDYQFNDLSLLLGALTHASGADHRLSSNERLEFLGDSILGLVICETLYRQQPHFLEGDLTKIKSVVVSRKTCAKVSKRLGLREFLILGKGMASIPTVPSSLLSDVFEALVAAIYLDGGFEAAKDFIQRHMTVEIAAAIAGESGGNYKSLLQQLAQREFGSTPIYQLVAETGPDHNKNFKITARVGDSQYQPAWGVNKKEAEQRAACNALSEIRGEAAPYAAD